MDVTAKLNRAPLSAQKGRLVADLIRNKDVSTAINVLTFTPKKAAKLMLKLLQSAVANAENNHGIDVDELTLSEVYVDEGPTMKRIKARAKGRSNRILKRTCHITVTVSDEE